MRHSSLVSEVSACEGRPVNQRVWPHARKVMVDCVSSGSLLICASGMKILKTSLYGTLFTKTTKKIPCACLYLAHAASLSTEELQWCLPGGWLVTAVGEWGGYSRPKWVFHYILNQVKEKHIFLIGHCFQTHVLHR